MRGNQDGADEKLRGFLWEHPGSNDLSLMNQARSTMRDSIMFPLNFSQFHMTKFSLLSGIKSRIKAHCVLCYLFCEGWNETNIQPNLIIKQLKITFLHSY